MKPAFQGIDITYKSKADNKDIRDLLEKLVPQAAGQLKSFSAQFKSNNIDNTCRKIFDYIKSNFRYVADKDEQIIKLPSALLRYKVGDCKSYSLFTAGILENLGIPYSFVYASYNDNPIPHHVYVQTESGCIIDVVYGKFNQEKKPKYKYKKNMNVRYMAGIGNCGCDKCRNNGMNGVGDWFKKQADAAGDKLKQLQNWGSEQQDAAKEAARKAEAKAKEIRDKALAEAKAVQDKLKQGAKTIGLSGGRNLMLLMIKNNLDGMASKIQNGNMTETLNQWYKLGGDRTKFGDAVRIGASKPAKKFGLLGKISKVFGGVNGIGAITEGQSSAIIALTTAAGTSLGSVIPALGTAAGAKAGGELGVVIVGMVSILDMIKKEPKTADTPLTTPTITPESEKEFDIDREQDSKTKSSDNTMLYVGGGALLLAGIYFATKKK